MHHFKNSIIPQKQKYIKVWCTAETIIMLEVRRVEDVLTRHRVEIQTKIYKGWCTAETHGKVSLRTHHQHKHIPNLYQHKLC